MIFTFLTSFCIGAGLVLSGVELFSGHMQAFGLNLLFVVINIALLCTTKTWGK